MLSSITPLGERGRGRRWGATATVYLVGSVVGGAALGSLLGLLGTALSPPPPAPAAAAVAVVCLLGAAVDLRLFGLRLPSVRRQVSEDWLSAYRGWVVGLGYGLQLGSGVVTIVTTATVYLTFALALLSASGSGGLVVGAAFGLVRALPVLGLRGVTTPARLAAAHRRLQAWAPLSQRVAVAAQCLLGVGLLLGGAR